MLRWPQHHDDAPAGDASPRLLPPLQPPAPVSNPSRQCHPAACRTAPMPARRVATALALSAAAATAQWPQVRGVAVSAARSTRSRPRWPPHVCTSLACLQVCPNANPSLHYSAWNTTACPADATCCPSLFSVSQVGCCPLPNAVCCSNGYACCPQVRAAAAARRAQTHTCTAWAARYVTERLSAGERGPSHRLRALRGLRPAASRT